MDGSGVDVCVMREGGQDGLGSGWAESGLGWVGLEGSVGLVEVG